MISRRLPRFLLLLLLMLAMAAPARAEVVITFYSRDLGVSFPHAFFTLRGTLDTDSAPVNVNYGFTAVAVTPAILFGPVKGKVENPSESMVAGSDAHASTTISDADYGKVLAVVEKWRTRPGKSYDLNKANCIHFVAEVARAIGMDAPDVPALMKKPKSFLVQMTEHNRTWLAARQANPSVAAAQ